MIYDDAMIRGVVGLIIWFHIYLTRLTYISAAIGGHTELQWGERSIIRNHIIMMDHTTVDHTTVDHTPVYHTTVDYTIVNYIPTAPTTRRIWTCPLRKIRKINTMHHHMGGRIRRRIRGNHHHHSMWGNRHRRIPRPCR